MFEGVIGIWLPKPTKNEPKREVLLTRARFFESLCDLSFRAKIVIIISTKSRCKQKIIVDLMKGIPIDYIFSLESNDRHYNKAQIQRHTRSQSIFFVTWHSLERRQCDKLDSFGPLPFSEEIKERLVIMSVPRMDVEA